MGNYRVLEIALDAGGWGSEVLRVFGYGAEVVVLWEVPEPRLDGFRHRKEKGMGIGL
jgi:hypothetical protein